MIPYLSNWKATAMVPSKRGTYRYSLSIEKNSGSNRKTLLVLLMNPSHSDLSQSDITTNNVLTIAGNLKNNYNKIIICNTFPIRESKTKNINIPPQKFLTRNQNEIDALLRKCDSVLIATGNMNVPNNATVKKEFESEYQIILKNIYQKANRCFVVHLNSGSHGLHASDMALINYFNSNSNFSSGNINFKNNCDLISLESVSITQNKNGSYSLT